MQSNSVLQFYAEYKFCKQTQHEKNNNTVYLTHFNTASKY